MKDDEKQFLLRVVKESKSNTPRDIINSEGFTMHHKRAWYLLGKWADKGWYDYGVTLDMGWITREGYEIVDSLQTTPHPHI